MEGFQASLAPLYNSRKWSSQAFWTITKLLTHWPLNILILLALDEEMAFITENYCSPLFLGLVVIFHHPYVVFFLHYFCQLCFQGSSSSLTSPEKAFLNSRRTNIYSSSLPVPVQCITGFMMIFRTFLGQKCTNLGVVFLLQPQFSSHTGETDTVLFCNFTPIIFAICLSRSLTCVHAR